MERLFESPILESKKLFLTDQVLTRKISSAPDYFKLLRHIIFNHRKAGGLQSSPALRNYFQCNLLNENFALFMRDLGTYAATEAHRRIRNSLMTEAFLCYKLA